ncbi:TIGR03619 family F420-dependent LLM class oxidoreductase [Planomonospora sp. ID91781]|uniref:F420-dependent oxidoreductase n=3 Tax=Planomonospora TaxID=1998 RepID=A0A161LHC2_9ACTN|nr:MULTISPECIES: TIGR03619 family F420-dependent LLM class oxidoreductase [Planomonospora]MBG0822275.1 TIGR03619 family F420-dependent LLM class oxidoreductase [Planomonospora sp. ID91781]GAT64597.1 F420-dependent oxidoreductase [Planomonospora sphaerica]GGK87976.1 LLM class F420-dependent oxidoreductase [Planomonospora parontospora]
MRIGFAVPVSGSWATPANMVRVARRAEELGYHELWTFQRLLYPQGHPMGPVYRSVHDPVVTLAYLAGATSRVRLGVAVLNMPFFSPALLAKQLASLQAVSGGRLDAGLGLGWLPEEFAASGTPFERRGARGEEFVGLLRRLWSEETVAHDGGFYRLPPVHQDPRPGTPPPILLGGSAEVALRRAGRLADGWISSSREDLTRIDEKIAVVGEAARAAGRDPGALRFVTRGVTRIRPAGAADRAPLSGSFEEIRKDVADLAARGVTDVFHDLNFDPEIGSPDADPEESMRRAEAALEALAP